MQVLCVAENLSVTQLLASFCVSVLSKSWFMDTSHLAGVWPQVPISLQDNIFLDLTFCVLPYRVGGSKSL